jgi:hypothetical protein
LSENFLELCASDDPVRIASFFLAAIVFFDFLVDLFPEVVKLFKDLYFALEFAGCCQPSHLVVERLNFLGMLDLLNQIMNENLTSLTFVIEFHDGGELIILNNQPTNLKSYLEVLVFD